MSGMTNHRSASPKKPQVLLQDVLAEEISLYEKYRDQLQMDTDFMVKLNLESLEQSNKIKNTLLLKIQTTDQARQNVVKQLAAQHDIQGDKIHIKEICEHLSVDESGRLMNLKEKLCEVRDSIQELREENQLLANSSLAWINGSMSSLHQILSPGQVYNGRGKVDAKSAYAGRKVEKHA